HFAARSILCGECAQISWYHTKSFPGRPERYHSKFLFLPQESRALRFDLGRWSRASLPEQNPSVSRYWNILNRSDRSGTDTNGRADGGCVNESALVGLYRRSPKHLQPAFPSAFHCLHA